MIGRFATFLVGTLILSLAVVIGARPDEQELPGVGNDSDLRTVRVADVELTAGSRQIRFPGVTRSTRRADVSFVLPGRIAERAVEIGDRVRAGQVIARLDDREYLLAEQSAAAALAELDVRLEQARRDEARVEGLFESRAATKEELEQVRALSGSLAAVRDASLARHGETRRLLEESTIRAPHEGVVTAVMLESGEWASPGKAVVEVAGVAAVEVLIEVPETIRAGIRMGSVVEVELPMLKKRATGRVNSVAGAASSSGGLFPVLVTLESDGGVVPGLTAEVVLSLEESADLTVPLAAVLDSGSRRPSVFKVSNGMAERVAIEPGRVVGDRLTVVADGLDRGDSVAIVGHTALVDGDLVEVR